MSSYVCLSSVLRVLITCVLMTYVEHDPMMEIVAKPLRYLNLFWSFAAQSQRYVL
jgi:hypothetical protein